ncbi:hypothetical protein D3C80_1975960 [compost metagenome]
MVQAIRRTQVTEFTSGKVMMQLSRITMLKSTETAFTLNLQNIALLEIIKVSLTLGMGYTLCFQMMISMSETSSEIMGLG